MLGWSGRLAEDANGPMFDWMGSVVSATEFNRPPNKVVFLIGGTLFGDFDPHTLGTDGNGKFDKFQPFCAEYLPSYGVGISGYILRPESAKRTDFLVDGATPVTINGLQWLQKDTGSTDLEGKFIRGGMSETEVWVLKIPETPHWLVFKLNSDKKFIKDNPEKHRAILDFFRKIVASVNILPITPVVDQHKLIILADCVRLHTNWAATCLFNEKSIIGDLQPSMQ